MYKRQAQRSDRAQGGIEIRRLPQEKLQTRTEVISLQAKPPAVDIAQADVLVVGGRGVKKKEDLALLEALARRLGGQLAVTRPLVEAGWADQSKQIGLSGRTVRPVSYTHLPVCRAVREFFGAADAREVIKLSLIHIFVTGAVVRVAVGRVVGRAVVAGSVLVVVVVRVVTAGRRVVVAGSVARVVVRRAVVVVRRGVAVAVGVGLGVSTTPAGGDVISSGGLVSTCGLDTGVLPHSAAVATAPPSSTKSARSRIPTRLRCAL